MKILGQVLLQKIIYAKRWLRLWKVNPSGESVFVCQAWYEHFRHITQDSLLKRFLGGSARIKRFHESYPFFIKYCNIRVTVKLENPYPFHWLYYICE